MSKQPPKLARKIFEWFAGNAFVDDLLGDQDELFFLNQKTKSLFITRWLYWKAILSLTFSYALRKRKQKAKMSMYSGSVLSFAMLQSYFKVAARSLYKHKYFSIVNAVGLSIGMSVSLLWITLYIHVNTFDNFHESKSIIYRIITSHHDAAREWELASAPFSLAEKLNRNFVGVKNTVRINSYFAGDAISGNLNIPIRGYYTEPSFLQIFNFPLLHGNAKTALVKPNSILLSESAAQKVFNSTDVLGKTLEIKDRGNFEVTGVMADPPKNSHMVFEVLVSYSTLPADEQVYAG